MTKFKAIDHFNGNEIVWPVLNARLKYDFIFRRKGTTQWRYLNSCDILDAFNAQIQSTIEHGGEYCILETHTGEIIKR
jgi:hypothetical protein